MVSTRKDGGDHQARSTEAWWNREEGKHVAGAVDQVARVVGATPILKKLPLAIAVMPLPQLSHSWAS
jgi:hypothetical protein